VLDRLRRLTEDSVDACDAVLARVWMVGPGDQCTSCPMRPECPNQTRCLHLVASAGTTARVDGAFRRFPIGAREVGMTIVRQEPFVARGGIDSRSLAESTWLAAHRVKSFAALPIVANGEAVGVLALFSRRELTDAEVRLIGFSIAQAVRAEEGRSGAAESGVDAVGRGAAAAGTTAESAKRAPGRLDDAQRDAIAAALETAGGRISGPRGAAAILGLHPNTLTSRMIRLGMRKRA
jgi:GAF domain/Bacterial regulatory protein, Fis family